MNDSSSTLKMEYIIVSEFDYKINTNVDFEKMEQIDISINPKPILRDNDKHKGLLELEVSLFDDDYIINKKPLHLKIVVLAYFADEETDTEENIFDKYLANIISMAYSYVRSYISSTTGLFGIRNINIPTVNVLKLLQNISENKKS